MYIIIDFYYKLYYIFLLLLRAYFTMQRKTNLIKINEKGVFQPFEGVTVISHAQPICLSMLFTLQKRLALIPSLTDYFSLLPPDSLHMTTMNLYVAAEKADWIQFIDTNLDFFQSLDLFLKENNTCFTGSVAAIENNGVIQLILNIPNNIKTEIERMACKFGLKNLIPHEFHMTLGYQYKNIPASTRDRLFSSIKMEIANLLDNAPPLTFESPALCYFNDMKKFINWDGKSNPFSNNHCSSSHHMVSNSQRFFTFNSGLKRTQSELALDIDSNEFHHKKLGYGNDHKAPYNIK